MSFAQSSYLMSPSLHCSAARVSSQPAVTKISFQKYGKSKIPLFYDDQKSNCSKRSLCGKTSSIFNEMAPHHPLEAELTCEQDHDEPGYDEEGGIGIVKFFQGKNIFITGGTGLVGKALIEKLLRLTSMGKIYVLIKAQDKQAAADRLHKEITSSGLLKVVSETHGEDYERFIQEKLIPVAGNICEPNLGMDPDSAQEIIQDVDVIVGSAASTTLNDKYDVLLETNVKAAERLMTFAKTCNNLKLFVHISTAYVNGRKEGLIFEKPLVLGEIGPNGVDDIAFPGLDIANEINLAREACISSDNVTKDLKRLGQERANHFWWHNAYQMTKAMGEMVLNEIRGDTPLLIIRPTVIESSYKQPFSGWIQGNRMFDPIIISHAKGQLPAFLGDPDAHMDIIPVDMVVNSTIAAIAKHGVTDKPELNVYQVASDVANPLQYGEFFEIIYEYLKSTPSFIANDLKKVKCFNNFEEFSKCTRAEILRQHNNNGADKKCKVKVAYAEQLCKTYEFVGFFKARFHTGNTTRLLSKMSKQEQIDFEIDPKNIVWRDYFLDSHIPGLEKHVMLS